MNMLVMAVLIFVCLQLLASFPPTLMHRNWFSQSEEKFGGRLRKYKDGNSEYIETFNFGIRAGYGNAQVIFRREIGIDRFVKMLGLCREIQTGDAAFDRMVYIVADDPGIAEALSLSPALRQAICSLLAIAKRIVIDKGAAWVEIDGIPFRKFDETTASEAKKYLETIQEAFVACETPRSEKAYISTLVVSGIAVALLILAFLLSVLPLPKLMPGVSVLPFVYDTSITVRFAVYFTVFCLALSVIVLRRTTYMPQLFMGMIICILCCAVSIPKTFCMLNVQLDRSPGRQMQYAQTDVLMHDGYFHCKWIEYPQDPATRQEMRDEDAKNVKAALKDNLPSFRWITDFLARRASSM